MFKLSPPVSGSAWTFRALHTFTLQSNAYGPLGLTMDSAAQNLYGITGYGRNGPSVFELSQPAGGGAWTYSQLYEFGARAGVGPRTPPLVDTAGNVYGTTAGGGSTGSSGAFYEITP